ncbi:MAG: hypothetical protein HYR88_15750 [Verrucomicrobia bacterium]|nr:hypothetical protein [Verrucomicrobiota bacterium]MBI3868586.1 hypothetical protein [Verrucomicrobiota bacterium]
MNTTTVSPSLGLEGADSVRRGDAGLSTLHRLTTLIIIGGAFITFGILWDISWHATIGRDTFWTPAHMMIYLGGTLSGCLAGWIAFSATFLKSEALRGVSVRLLGAWAPLGAWVTIWGALAMLTSAPLDDWWHNAYGLDVKILSPPHALLAAGMYGVVTGGHLLAAAARNRAVAGGVSAGVAWLPLVANGVQLALSSILLTELSFPNLQRSATFAMASAALYPTFLVSAARQSATRWAATKMSFVYMAVMCVMVWILPLFPAEPKLAPIFNRLTHMAPPAFPHLLFIPALALDLLAMGIRNKSGWAWEAGRVLGSATLFLVLFLFVQWHFSAFLISPMADNAFFAGHGRYFSYMGDLQYAGQFWERRNASIEFSTLGWAGLIAIASALVGSRGGRFLTRILR